MTLTEVFDDIYSNNRWEGTESYSGVGAGTVARDYIAKPIADLVARLGVRSVLDVGCGDGYWMPDLPGYIGVDVSQVAIDLARVRHPRRDYRVDDGSPYPSCELVISRCVIQHLSYADAQVMLARIRVTEPSYFLVTTYLHGLNEDVVTGRDGYWPDMRKEPFSMGEPLLTIADGQSDYKQQYGCVLGLWPG